jgi:tetratricopeptide (TPR) repeat protein
MMFSDQPSPDFLMCKPGAFLLLFLLLLSAAATAQPRRHRPAPSAPAVSQQNVDEWMAQAAQEREAGRLDEAIAIYRKVVSARPAGNEAWWYLATLLYERDRYLEAATAFKRVTQLTPKVGLPWAMLGLCEFRLRDYDNSLAHLRQGRQMGFGDNQEIIRSVRYHEAQLLLLKNDFEVAQSLFDSLSYDNINTENLIIAHGLAALRISQLPDAIDPGHRDRDLIRRTGYCAHLVAQKNMGDAQQQYERLAADFPKALNVQYVYGRFLYDQRNDDGAIAAFKREIENSPNHALARLMIAWIKLRDKEFDAGLPFAEEAVKLHPRLPLAHYILGRMLLENGDAEKSIGSLEISQKLAPNEPKVYFSLSRAYAKVGRKEDAERARETFARLNKQAEQSAARGFYNLDDPEDGSKAKP